jgi:hypothetical protein
LSSTIRAAPKYVEEVQAIKHFEEKERRTIQRAIDGGYYRLDEQKDRYRLTLKGTYLLTWKLLPPFKQIRLRLNARKARVEMSLIPPALLQSPKTPPPPLAAVRTGPA